MNQFQALMYYELKKILSSKAVLLALIVSVGLLFAITMFEYLVISPNDRYVFETEKDLDGRAIDEVFVAEIVDEAEKAGGLKKLSGSDSRYSHAAKLLSSMLGDGMNFDDIPGEYAKDGITAALTYQTRRSILDHIYDQFRLSDAEKAWWNRRDEQIAKPFVWRTNYGIRSMRANSDACVVMLCLLVGISLAGVFAMEKAGRTDALVLSSKLGRSSLWLVKFATGEVFALLSGAALMMAVQLPNIVFNGLHGVEGAWQLLVPFSSYPHTAGHMLLVYLGIYLLSCLCVGALVMLLSLAFGNMIAAAGVTFLLTILDLFFAVPPGFRVLSQLRCLTPVQIFNNSSMTDPRLVPFFGYYLNALQAAGILYAAIAVLCMALVRRLYRRQEVA